MSSNNSKIPVALGVNQLFINVPELVVAKRSPLFTDNWPIGTTWIEPIDPSGTAVNDVWIATRNAGGGTTWTKLSGGTGVFTSLTVNPGPTNLSTVGNGAVNIGNSANTQQITIDAGVGNFVVNGNGHSILIGDDAHANTVSLGSLIAGSLTSINGGDGTGVGTAAIEITTAAAGDIVIGATTQTGALYLGPSTAGMNINIGTGAAAVNTIDIGGTGANVITIGDNQTGGSIAMGSSMTTGTISIGGVGLQTGAIDIAPSLAAQIVSIANNDGAKIIDIGNGVDGNTITIGGGINTSPQTINIASGASAANSIVDILTGVSTAGSGTFNVLTGLLAQAGAVNIATGTAAHVVQIGSQTGAAATSLFAGTGGLHLVGDSGNTSLAPAPATVASPTVAVTLDARVGRVIWTGFTTANAGATQALTVNNANVLNTSGLFVNIAHLNASGNGAELRIEDITQGVGSFVVTYSNNGAGALGAGDNIILTWWVIS